jgi:hypothetical protein
MTLETACEKLRDKIVAEQNYWTERKREAADDECDVLVTDAHARLGALASVIRMMDQLGIAAEK